LWIMVAIIVAWWWELIIIPRRRTIRAGMGFIENL